MIIISHKPKTTLMNFNIVIYKRYSPFSRFIILTFLSTLPFLISSCGNKKTPDQNNNQVKSFSVLTIVPQKTTLNVDYPATIEGQQNIEIRPKVDGFIQKIYIDEGATVKKGQLLFTISAPQYEQGVRTARANIQIAQADVKSAEMNVEKVKPLVEKNIISKYELESAQYILQAKQAALAQANATLANANINIGYTSITSPVNGIVGTIPFKIGSLVSSTTAQPLTTVSNVGNIYAYFSINEKDAFSFEKDYGSGGKSGLESLPQVSLILSDGNIFPEKGRIETTSGMINSETGSSTLRATFPNPGSIVRSGSSGSVRIPLSLDSAILVPQKATYEIQGKTFVYVVSDSGTVNSVPIIVGNNSNGKSYVVKDGLKPGDKIVIDGIANLRDGLMIKPQPINQDSLYQILVSTK